MVNPTELVVSLGTPKESYSTPRYPASGDNARKNKKPQAFTACGGQVGAPHELFARPPLSPLFHLYTLAPLSLRRQSGRSRKSLLLDLSRT